MSNYPLHVEFMPNDLLLSTEDEVLQHFVDEFQKQDPSLSPAHIRGSMVEQLRSILANGKYHRQERVFITCSTAQLLQDWKDVPYEFILAAFEHLKFKHND
jgi:hypothetical protein